MRRFHGWAGCHLLGREHAYAKERGYIVEALREGSCVRNVGRKKKGLVRVFVFRRYFMLYLLNV